MEETRALLDRVKSRLAIVERELAGVEEFEQLKVQAQEEEAAVKRAIMGLVKEQDRKIEEYRRHEAQLLERIQEKTPELAALERRIAEIRLLIKNLQGNLQEIGS